MFTLKASRLLIMTVDFDFWLGLAPWAYDLGSSPELFAGKGPVNVLILCCRCLDIRNHFLLNFCKWSPVKWWSQGGICSMLLYHNCLLPHPYSTFSMPQEHRIPVGPQCMGVRWGSQQGKCAVSATEVCRCWWSGEPMLSAQIGMEECRKKTMTF